MKLFILCIIAVPVEIVVSPMNTVHFAGGNVSLRCSVRGIPEPSITWFKNGDLLTEEDNVVILAEKTVDQNHITIVNILAFQELVLSNDAEYRCVANNTGVKNVTFQVSNSANLTVQCKYDNLIVCM